MADEFRIERRRSPRTAARRDVSCRLDVRVRVQVVDISASGALLASDTAPPVGSAAHLRTALGAATFASDVEVKRRGTVAKSAAVGVVFTAKDERNRQVLEHFLKKASA
jgi:hypothetical protein